MKDCNKFDTGMAEPKLENLWSNPFVFSSTIKYLKYKKKVLYRCNLPRKSTRFHRLRPDLHRSATCTASSVETSLSKNPDQRCALVIA